MYLKQLWVQGQRTVLQISCCHFMSPVIANSTPGGQVELLNSFSLITQTLHNSYVLEFSDSAVLQVNIALELPVNHRKHNSNHALYTQSNVQAYSQRQPWSHPRSDVCFLLWPCDETSLLLQRWPMLIIYASSQYILHLLKAHTQSRIGRMKRYNRPRQSTLCMKGLNPERMVKSSVDASPCPCLGKVVSRFAEWRPGAHKIQRLKDYGLWLKFYSVKIQWTGWDSLQNRIMGK